MKGKTVVITGGTSGIGEIAAERLAQMGARIVLIARDKSRGEATLARLHERAPGLGHAVHYADLARIPEMKRVAADIAHEEPRIDGGNVRAITDFDKAKTAIHSLRRCIRRRKPPDARKIERSLSRGASVALHHGLRIDPLAHTHKDFS